MVENARSVGPGESDSTCQPSAAPMNDAMADDLNYHHLKYFWVVACEGSIAKACGVLHLSQPTISGQIRELEKSIGDPLFERAGRNLRLTQTGRLVKGYCDELFAVGRELHTALAGDRSGRVERVVVGIADSLSKLIAYRLLAPALTLAEPVRLECIEGRPERLLAELATHQIDVVLSDAPVGPEIRVKAYNHLLAECPLAIFAAANAPALTALKSGFPQSLHQAPILLPLGNAAIRQELDGWLGERELVPRIVAECQDSALLKSFGQAAVGLFPGPAVISEEICRMYQAVEIGRIASVKQRFYAISVERRLTHPAVVAISQAAKKQFR